MITKDKFTKRGHKPKISKQSSNQNEEKSRPKTEEIRQENSRYIEKFVRVFGVKAITQG